MGDSKSKRKIQNVKLQSKNSQVSHGTCGHGLLYNCRESSTNQPIFMQNKANFRKSQMDVKFNISIDYEKKLYWIFGENKPNLSTRLKTGQSQLQNRKRRTACPAGMASNYDMQPTSAKKVLTGIHCVLISSGYKFTRLSFGEGGLYV